MNAPATRDAILDATESLLVEHGLDGTSMDRVRRAAGVSNGSLFHHYPTKPELIAALYLRTLGEYHAIAMRALDRKGSPEQTVTALVRAHLTWVIAHPGRARLLHEMRWSEEVSAAKEPLAAMNRAIFARLRAWARPLMDRGELRDVPIELLVAIVLGPAMELTRAWLRDPDPARARRAVAVLANAAWEAVRGRPKQKGRSNE